MVHRLLAAALTALLLLAAAAPADAAVTRKKAIWGPAFKDGVSQFPIYADLGAGIWQYTLAWNGVAPDRPASPRDPSDPAYRWPADLDQAVSEAARHGIAVNLAVVGAPAWANGGRDWRWAPTRADDYADFVEAAARRYPAVRHWQIWIEPTKATNFQPLAPVRGRRLRGAALEGAQRYAALLDAAYRRLKGLSRRNLVIGGNTFTVGTVPPLTWIAGLRLASGKRPRFDLWGHNPFTLRKPNLRKGPLGNGYADFSDLDTLARALDRAARPRRPKIYVSEFALPVDRPNWQFNFYVSRRVQAEWIAAALRITRRWPRLYSFGYLGLYDEEPRPANDHVLWGLLDPDGQRRPAYAAYRDG